MKAVEDEKAPDFTDEEVAEMLQTQHPDALISDEEKTRIRQHGTRKEKTRLKLIEHLLTERNNLKDVFFKQKGKPNQERKS